MTKGKFLGYLLGIVLLVGGVMSCSKKDLSTGSTTGTTTTTTSTTTQLIDSLFLYAKQLYLWYDQLPDSSSFKPLQYTSVSGTDSTKATAEIFALTRYAINSSTGKSYEYYDNDGDTSETKYSFIEGKDADQNAGTSVKSYVTLAGWGNDLGFYGPVFNEDSIFCFRMFYENSPAYNAGLRRGNCFVYKVNGKGFSYNNKSDLNTLSNAINSSSISMSYYDSIGKSHDVTLTQTRYSSNPIFADTVWTVGSKKIGYFAFLNFADPDNVKANLNTLFAKFSSAGVTDLVVDLRYNGGGYVETSQQIANLIAPSSLNGQTMFTENYNALMQAGNATMLKGIVDEDNPTKTYYDYSWKASDYTYKFTGGNLTLGNVCFIVSDGTASASELLMNNLKPHMTVKLIGTTLDTMGYYLPKTTKTYGKPVGFFGIPIGNYDVYLSEFESRNSSNTAVPYDGMVCDVTDWDDFSHNFTNTKEDAVAQAINYITNGSFLTPTTVIGVKSTTRNSNTLNFSSVISALKQGSGSSQSISSLHNSVQFKALKTFDTKGKLPTHLGMIETKKVSK